MDHLILRGEPPNGSGSGYGYGYGYGSAAYWRSAVEWFASKWPKPQQERLAALCAEGATIAFWRSDADGRACNGGRGLPAAKSGAVHTAPGPLNLCHAGTLHATLLPPKWEGTRWWIVALIGEVVGNEEKYGALTREIIGEAL